MTEPGYLKPGKRFRRDIEDAGEELAEGHPVEAAEIIIGELVGWHRAERIRSYFKLLLMMAVLGFLVYITVDIHKNHELLETIINELRVVPCSDPLTIGCLVYNQSLT
jgi:hypothetical protein